MDSQKKNNLKIRNSAVLSCFFYFLFQFFLVMVSFIGFSFVLTIMISILIWNDFLGSALTVVKRNVLTHVPLFWKTLFSIIVWATQQFIGMVACAPVSNDAMKTLSLFFMCICIDYSASSIKGVWGDATLEQNKKIRICGRPCLCLEWKSYNAKYNQSYGCWPFF